jgi:hypothetical protein
MPVQSDFSDINRMAAQLSEVAVNAGPYVRSAVEVTSRKVKDDAAAAVKAGSKSWKALPRTIDYEVSTFRGFGSTVIQADIGYRKDRAAGNLGNIREYGSAHAAPHSDLQVAAQKNQADFIDGLSMALADAERVLDANSSLSKSVRQVLGGRL